jgi:hypothetical protein
MSGLEAIAVIGVVASLITAFKDSNSIANAIKQRRRAKPGALPPSIELEEALTAGEQEIQKAAAEGIRRWGQNWVDDEVDAKMALQAIVIEVQASMLRDLSIAVQDDSITDVRPRPHGYAQGGRCASDQSSETGNLPRFLTTSFILTRC